MAQYFLLSSPPPPLPVEENRTEKMEWTAKVRPGREREKRDFAVSEKFRGKFRRESLIVSINYNY